MSKRPNLSLRNSEEIPDHILETIERARAKLLKFASNELEKMPPELLLAAFNQVHALIILMMATEDVTDIEDLGVLESQAMLLNMKQFSTKDIYKDLSAEVMHEKL